MSTTFDRKFAESFLDFDEDSGKIPVLFQINFKANDDGDGYYLMNNTAYSEEKEVIIIDGFEFKVQSVE